MDQIEVNRPIEVGNSIIIGGEEFSLVRPLKNNTHTRIATFLGQSIAYPRHHIVFKEADLQRRELFLHAAACREKISLDATRLSRYFAMGSSATSFYTASNYIPGVDFRFIESYEPYSPERIMKTIQAIRGLIGVVGEINEQEVLHRDVCPGNSIVGFNDDVSVIDTDFMASMKDASMKKSMGNPLTIAPEIAREEGGTLTSDTYSIGCTGLWIMEQEVRPKVFLPGYDVDLTLENKKSGTLWDEKSLRQALFDKLNEYDAGFRPALKNFFEFLVRSTVDRWTQRPANAAESLAIIDGRK